MAKCRHFLVITQGNLDHLFSYAAGNGRDQKSDLALQSSCPGGLEKAGGGSVSLQPSLTCFDVFLHLLPHTHTHIYSRCTHVVRHRYTQICKGSGEQTREGKVDAMILFGGGIQKGGCRRHTTRCYIAVQSNDSERTRHISMQPPSTRHALLSRSSGTTL